MKPTGLLRSLQLELFEIEFALSEFEKKRKEIRARLNQLGAGMKTCTKCKEEMEIEQFYRDNQKFDKRSSWCRECVTQAVMTRYHKAELRRKGNVKSGGVAA